ncbi:conserved protein of unknown function [Ruminococcaceae bacterium BL-6]|nr:conserved protein of unknown function [Ruminococcaceae bacterium BL-6]
MAIQIKETSYKNYGRCVQITNGIIEVMVTIDVGPRIIFFGFVNGENVFYNDLDRNVSFGGEEFDELYGKGQKALMYGGHRLWLSPESYPGTYYPDNEPVVYGILPDGVSFTPPKQKHNSMQLGFEVMMNENASDIMVVHSAKNCAKETQTLALWAVSMMAPNGLEIIPQTKEKGSGLLPNRSLIFWPYSRIGDPRVFFGEKFITIRHDPTCEAPYKFGLNNLSGWAAYVRQNTALVRHFVHNIHAAYPDMGASYETYFCKDYAEMETLSPLYHIEPGESVRHVENLTLFRIDNIPDARNEQKLEEFIENLQ